VLDTVDKNLANIYDQHISSNKIIQPIRNLLEENDKFGPLTIQPDVLDLSSFGFDFKDVKIVSTVD
jgi:hypothetical protein